MSMLQLTRFGRMCLCEGRILEGRQRFSPQSYSPMALRRREFSGYSRIRSPIGTCHSREELSRKSEKRTPQERRIEPQLVRGRSLGLDKTVFSEEESQAFLLFLENADKKKKPYSRRPRPLPSTGNTR
jgi:hypothetical protein